MGLRIKTVKYDDFIVVNGKVFVSTSSAMKEADKVLKKGTFDSVEIAVVRPMDVFDYYGDKPKARKRLRRVA